MSTSLQMRDVQKSFGPFQAVRDFNIEVAAGEFVSFLGPSGSGKTTALRMIAGFDDPSAGDILLGERSIIRIPSHERDIGMVFQNYALFPHMTVEENVAFPLTIRGMPRSAVTEKVKQVLLLVRMEGMAHRYPNQISGGQQQRVALARAICFNPSVLLMDEPLGALDRHLREHMKIELMRIQAELRITVIFVTHDQDEALTMSDRIAVINNGRLVQFSDSRTLYYDPADRFVASFVGESNLIPCNVDSVSADGSSAITIGENKGIEVPDSSDITVGPRFFFIRPEHLTLSPTEVEVTSHLDGLVEQVFFLGEMTRYVVRTGDHLFRVKELNVGQKIYNPGDPVRISWKTAHAKLVI